MKTKLVLSSAAMQVCMPQNDPWKGCYLLEGCHDSLFIIAKQHKLSVIQIPKLLISMPILRQPPPTIKMHQANCLDMVIVCTWHSLASITNELYV